MNPLYSRKEIIGIGEHKENRVLKERTRFAGGKIPTSSKVRKHTTRAHQTKKEREVEQSQKRPNSYLSQQPRASSFSSRTWGRPRTEKVRGELVAPGDSAAQ